MTDQPATLHPLLRGLKPAWLAAIGECSVQSNHRSGDYLFRAGDAATRLYLLQSGHVGIELGIEKQASSQVAVLGPGDLIACPCSGRMHTWRFSVPAFDQVSCQSILVKRLRKLCDADRELACELGERIICSLADQLDAARRQFAEVSQLALNSQRLALETFGQQRNAVEVGV